MTADPFRPPETDEEPWPFPEPDAHPEDRYRWLVFAAIVVVVILLGIVRWR